MKSVLISIGDELVLGQTVDTNAAWLADRLIRLGITCARHETVADDCELIAGALRRAASDADIVIVTGGLGPTADDLTRDALAQALGVGLEIHEPSLRRIEAFFQERGKPMAKRNRVQAMHPAGTDMIDNDAGTAPGIHAKINQADIFITPGVPREMRWMFDHHIQPALQQNAAADTLLTTKINTLGMGESDVAERLGNLMDRDRNPTVGTTVSDGLCSVRIRSVHADADTAREQLEETAVQVEACMGALAFSRGDQTLQEAIVGALRETGHTLATAESCTGGLVGAMLTEVPGASEVFAGGWVTYSNAMKASMLDVDPALIEEHGAVSAQIAEAMARGAREKSGADLALSITGVAGPGGGTDAKPVGTVWIGLAHGTGVTSYLARFAGGGFSSRAIIRDRAAKCALQLLRLHLLGEDPALIRWLEVPTGP